MTSYFKYNLRVNKQAGWLENYSYKASVDPRLITSLKLKQDFFYIIILLQLFPSGCDNFV